MVLEAPQGDLPDSRPKGDEAPEGSKSGPGPDTVPEPSMVPNSGGHPLVREGEPSASRTSLAPEAPDCLLEALRGASMDEEHRTLMSLVIRKVTSSKSRLTEACTGLLIGFEVRS